MNPSRLFILRPVGTTLLMVAMLLVGIVSYRFLPISALPEVDYPTIQVSTFYPGASPEVMTTAVTAPLERQFGEMPGLSQMSSGSSAGASVITLQFDLSLSLDVAEEEVQAAINAATNLLPQGLPSPPVYNKVNPADAPVITLAITSNTLSLIQLEDLADLRIAQKLSQVSGVSLVSLAGGNRPALRIEVNPRALASLGIAIDDIRTDVTNQNLDQPKGSFDGPMRASTINGNDQLQTPEAYRNLIVAYKNGGAIRLRDVANVIQGPQDSEQAAWANGTPAIILNIQRQPGSNVIAVVDAVKAALPKLRQAMPAGLDLAILADQTTTIRASVSDVEFDLALSIGLVVAVIFVFLGDARATLAPALAAPLSLVGALAGMYMFGFSIDNLSLMSLTIATGFVVDDAIVMTENIARYIEQGEKPFDAALRGAGEIGFTIISLTVSLIAVLIPLLFMQDVVGRLFHEFAITLALAIVLSAVVSLTLTPMICSLVLRPHDEHGKGGFARVSERAFNWLVGEYDRGLLFVMNHQFLTLIVFTVTLVVTCLQYLEIPKGFFPVQDTGAILGLTSGPQDISFKAMAERQQELARALAKDEDVASVSSFIGVDGTNMTLNAGRLQIGLKSLGERKDNVETAIARMSQEAAKVPGISVALQPVQDLTIDSISGHGQYLFFLETPDASQFTTWIPRLIERLSKVDGFEDVVSDMTESGRQLQVTVDRSTAARFGVTVASIDNALYDAFGQRIASTYYTQSNQYRVILSAAIADLADPEKALDGIYLPSVTSTSGQVPLSAIVHVTQAKGPLQIEHLGQFPSVGVSFNLAPGYSLDKAVGAIQQAERDVGLPATFTTAYQGALSAFQKSLSNELALIAAAVVAVYIVLGVLYESFLHPITILSTLPSAGVGALLALRAAGEGLDIIGIIGIVLLIGIVKKNAIMIIEFALEAERVEGMSPREAIRQACLLRFRPILMTTMAALFGAVPLAFGEGVGAELRRPLGVCIIGGLLVSQVLTLYTTPVIYLLLEGASARVRGWFAPAPRKAPAE
jgi:multidrug efflux pump